MAGILTRDDPPARLLEPHILEPHILEQRAAHLVQVGGDDNAHAGPVGAALAHGDQRDASQVRWVLNS